MVIAGWPEAGHPGLEYMKSFSNFVRFQDSGGSTRFGVSDRTEVADLTDTYRSWTQLLQAVAAGTLNASLLPDARIPMSDVKLLAPIDDSCRAFGVALNYHSHVNEVGREPPEAPLIFMVPNSSMVGPEDDITGLDRSKFLDYEAELAVVIGREAAKVSVDDAFGYIAGATLFNDVTARDLMFPNPEKRGIPDWLSAKSLDGSSPLGPYLYRPESVTDIDAFTFQMELNGELIQQGDPADRVFSIAELISFLSHRITLQPGDVIATGTPTGTGNGRGVPLAAGDHLVVTSPEIGKLSNRVAG